MMMMMTMTMIMIMIMIMIVPVCQPVMRDELSKPSFRWPAFSIKNGATRQSCAKTKPTISDFLAAETVLGGMQYYDSHRDKLVANISIITRSFNKI